MNHHPDIAISWSQVEVAISTHAEGGLTENDFELAKKVEEIGLALARSCGERPVRLKRRKKRRPKRRRKHRQGVR